MTDIADDNYEQARKRVYKHKSTDPVFLEAQSIIKYQSRRVGSLQGWNTRYRQRIEILNQAVAETEELRQQLQLTRQTLVTTLQNKAVLESEYDTTLAELEKIDKRMQKLKRSYQLATQVTGTTSFQDRWAMVLQAVKDLLFPPADEPVTKSALPTHEKDWADDTIDNIQRDLYENK